MLVQKGGGQGKGGGLNTVHPDRCGKDTGNEGPQRNKGQGIAEERGMAEGELGNAGGAFAWQNDREQEWTKWGERPSIAYLPKTQAIACSTRTFHGGKLPSACSMTWRGGGSDRW